MPSNSRLLGMALARAWLRTYVRDPTHTREHAAEAVLLRLASRRAESAHAALLVRVDFLDLHELHGPFDRRRVELSELVARHVEEDGPVPLLLSGFYLRWRRLLLPRTRSRPLDAINDELQQVAVHGAQHLANNKGRLPERDAPRLALLLDRAALDRAHH